MLPFGLDPVQFLLAAGALLAVLVLLAWIIGSISGTTGNKGRPRELDRERRTAHNWARYKQVRDLSDTLPPDPRRLRLCQLDGHGLANPPLRSKLVLAPSGAGKTPRVVVPDVLRHNGPAVVTSIKGDVLALTRHNRQQRGRVWIFDPSQSVGPTARWSPLAHVQTWADALDAARSIQECSKVDGTGGLQDREFWDAQARYLLAPLIHLAAARGKTMADIAGLVVGGDETERMVTNLLDALADSGPRLYWARFVGLEHKTKSSVLITAATVLEAWTHPRVAAAVNVHASDPEALDLDELLTGPHTLYLVSPASEQQMFTPIYEAMVNAITQRVEAAYHQHGSTPLDPPLLLALDEAANIAPLRRLDYLASAGAGQGIIVLSVWQDEGQIEQIYGPSKARSIRANHYAKLYLPGISDHTTLAHLAEQIGDTQVTRTSTSTSQTGDRSTTRSHETIQVAPPVWLRQLDRQEVVVILGHYPPILGTLPAWFDDKQLRALIPGDVAADFDRIHSQPGRRRGRGRRVGDQAGRDHLTSGNAPTEQPPRGPLLEDESVQGWYANHYRDHRRTDQP